jgi:hypothetical protein
MGWCKVFAASYNYRLLLHAVSRDRRQHSDSRLFQSAISRGPRVVVHDIAADIRFLPIVLKDDAVNVLLCLTVHRQAPHLRDSKSMQQFIWQSLGADPFEILTRTLNDENAI